MTLIYSNICENLKIFKEVISTLVGTIVSLVAKICFIIIAGHCRPRPFGWHPPRPLERKHISKIFAAYLSGVWNFFRSHLCILICWVHLYHCENLWVSVEVVSLLLGTIVSLVALVRFVIIEGEAVVVIFG